MVNYTVIEKDLIKSNPLFLENFNVNYAFEDFSLKDFILTLLVNLFEENNTIDSVTYERVCGKSKRRSISDIFNVCRYYYDNVTLEEVQYWLAVLWKEKKIGYFYCNGIKKRVYMSFDYYKKHTINPVQYASPDEHNISTKEIEKLGTLNLY